MFAAQETSGTVVPLWVVVLSAQEHKLLGQCWLSAGHASTTQAQHKNNIGPAPRVCFSGYLPMCVHPVSACHSPSKNLYLMLGRGLVFVTAQLCGQCGQPGS